MKLHLGKTHFTDLVILPRTFAFFFTLYILYVINNTPALLEVISFLKTIIPIFTSRNRENTCQPVWFHQCLYFSASCRVPLLVLGHSSSTRFQTFVSDFHRTSHGFTCDVIFFFLPNNSQFCWTHPGIRQQNVIRLET